METRERIVGAAERVIRDRGLARATTREIAREANCSEGNLYRHFENKEALFLTVLSERLPSFVGLLRELPERVGEGEVRETLEEIGHGALAFYHESVPMAAGVFSEPGLLKRHRQALQERNAGPHVPNDSVAAYLRAEQSLGRVRQESSSEGAAALLLGACHQRAFHLHFRGEELPGEAEERFIGDLVEALMEGLSPE